MNTPFQSLCITGASRGLGAALARRAAAPGVRMLLVARGAAALEGVAAECRARGAEAAEAAALDVRDAPALARALRGWDDRHPLDLLVANAGVTGGTGPGGELEGWESADRVLGVNLLGAVNAVEPLLPRLVARRRGRIGLIASVAGLRGLPDSPAYCASKHGLRGYGESLRPLLAPLGVGVTVVQPGFFESAMSERFVAAQMGRLGLDAAAERTWRALVAGKGRATFPWALGAGMRLLDLLPAPLADWAVRRYRFTIRPEGRPEG